MNTLMSTVLSHHEDILSRDMNFLSRRSLCHTITVINKDFAIHVLLTFPLRYTTC